jgi:hypothetical protein
MTLTLHLVVFCGDMVTSQSDKRSVKLHFKAARENDTVPCIFSQLSLMFVGKASSLP